MTDDASPPGIPTDPETDGPPPRAVGPGPGAAAGGRAAGGPGPRRPEPPDPGAASAPDPGAASAPEPDPGAAPAPEPDPRSSLAVESAPAPQDPGDARLLGLVDRLAALLERSDLTELEVGSGDTALVLRMPSALAPAVSVATIAPAVQSITGSGEAPTPGAIGGEPAAQARPSVKAPLTGIFYTSPAIGSAPYVVVGREVAVGQVIGLIEAMKLFNEIKSDLAGRVVRVVAESGSLVKAKQALIEVEPL